MVKKFTVLNEETARYVEDINPYVRSLALSHVIRQGLISTMIPELALPRNGLGIDVGCGIGLPACMIKVVRPDLNIIGIDLSDEFITKASDIAKAADISVSFQQASAFDLPFDNESLEWVFSMDCVNYAPGTGEKAIHQSFKKLKPGGKIILAAWSSQQIIPGYPLLEAKLNATKKGIAPFKTQMAPDRHFMMTAKALSKAGFNKTECKAISQPLVGPLNKEQKMAVRDLIQMRWPKRLENLSQKERKTLNRFVDPGVETDPFEDPFYFGYFTYTCFIAIK